MNNTSLSSKGLFLKKKVAFDSVKKRGKRYKTALFTIVSEKTSLGRARMGIIVSRRFGNAVTRNRGKRIFRELSRLTQHKIGDGWDIVIFPRSAALSVDPQELWNTWKFALSYNGLLNSVSNLSCGTSSSP